MVFLGAADVDIPADVRPWARPGPERERRERHAALLVGDSIAAVTYFGTPSWPWRYSGFDSISHGVELATRGGHTFSSTWAIDRAHVGLSFRREAMRPRWMSGYTHLRVWEPEPGGWAALMTRPIDEVRLLWWDQSPPDGADGCHAVSLRAGEHTVHLVLGGVAPDDGVEGQDDNVAVVFDEAVAERARLGPWMP